MVALVLLVVTLAAIWMLTEQTPDETSTLSAGAARVVAATPDVLACGDSSAAGGDDASLPATGGDGSVSDDGGTASSSDGGEVSSLAGGDGASTPDDGAGTPVLNADSSATSSSKNAKAGSSALSGQADGAETSAVGLATLISRASAWIVANIRRVAHTVEFLFAGLFATIAAVCLVKNERSLRWLTPRVLLFCVACSLVDQTHKLFVPGRHFDCVDLAFDAAGYVVGIALALGVAALVCRIENSRIERAESSW